jgi:hypothetical protein
VCISRRVEAEEPGAIGSDPAPVAVAAERRRNRCDDSEYCTVGEDVAFRGRVRSVVTLCRRGPAEALSNAGQDLVARNHAGQAPLRCTTHIHVFDVAQLGLLRPRELEQVADLVLVESTDDDAVDLDRTEPRVPRGADALDDVSVSGAARERDEPLGPQGVEAHGHAIETRSAKRACRGRQQHAIRGEGEIGDLGNGAKRSHQDIEVMTQEGLTTGESDLRRAQPGEDPGEPGQLLEREYRLARQPGVFRLGHAIAAAEVAAIGDRESQAAERPREGIAHGGDHSGVRAMAGTVPPGAVGSTHASDPSL